MVWSYNLVVLIVVAMPLVVTVVTVASHAAGVIRVVTGLTVAVPVKGTMAWVLGATEAVGTLPVRAMMVILLTIGHTIPMKRLRPLMSWPMLPIGALVQGAAGTRVAAAATPTLVSTATPEDTYAAGEVLVAMVGELPLLLLWR